MANPMSDATRYYFTEQTVALPAGSRRLLAREDGTKWVQDSDRQLHQVEGVFNEEEMAAYRQQEFVTHAALKKQYDSAWGPNSSHFPP
jgi:predicted HD phosphohydrolase